MSGLSEETETEFKVQLHREVRRFIERCEDLGFYKEAMVYKNLIAKAA